MSSPGFETYITQESADARYQALGGLGSSTPTTVDVGDVGTAGVSSSAARADHEHPVGITSSQLVPAAAIGAWSSWVPTYGNFTLGNGTVEAKYVQFGKTVHYKLAITLGSTSAVGGDMTFSLPVTSVTHTDQHPIGLVDFADVGTASFGGPVRWQSTTTARVLSWNGAANGQVATISATLPFVWTTSDRICISGTYEAA